MRKQVSYFVAERSVAWGNKRIFGYSVDGINGVWVSYCAKKTDGIYIDTPLRTGILYGHVHAKSTGEVGLCMATSGPVAIRLFNGLYDTNQDPLAGCSYHLG